MRGSPLTHGGLPGLQHVAQFGVVDVAGLGGAPGGLRLPWGAAGHCGGGLGGRPAGGGRGVVAPLPVSPPRPSPSALSPPEQVGHELLGLGHGGGRGRRGQLWGLGGAWGGLRGRGGAPSPLQLLGELGGGVLPPPVGTWNVAALVEDLLGAAVTCGGTGVRGGQGGTGGAPRGPRGAWGSPEAPQELGGLWGFVGELWGCRGVLGYPRGAR